MVAFRRTACVTSGILVSVPVRCPRNSVRQRLTLTRPTLFLVVWQRQELYFDVRQRLTPTDGSKSATVLRCVFGGP